jgi:type IV pilus assembly protein PilA
MLRLHRRSKGFTLIELMIVVAIIGILAAIAIPRFANLIDRAKEARTQGNLGSLRSACAIYYGTNNGTWPTTLGAAGSTSTLIYATAPGPYMATIPQVMLPSKMGHTPTSAETTTNGDAGDWFYDGVGVSTTAGTLYVNCTHTDSTGAVVNTW